MLTVQGYADLLNDNTYKLAIKSKWAAIYYGMSLHIEGACPYYDVLGEGDNANYTRIIPYALYSPEYQYIFETKLFSRHPRENRLTRQWRFSQYKPFQQAPFLQCIQMVTGALFQDSGYSISIENKEDSEFIWDKNFDGHTLVGYVNDKAKNIFEDPNGVFIVIPKEPYYSTTTNYIEPEIWFIPSVNIVHLTKDEIVFSYGDYHWAVNGYGYFRYQKNEDTGLFENADGEYGYYFAHMMLKTPAIKAGGIWNTQGFYDSWLHAGKPIADEYVSSKSAEQLVMKEASHPFIIEVSEDCPDCSATGKVQWCNAHNCSTESPGCDCTDNTNYVLHSCQKCRGAGIISHNPGDRIIAPKDDMGNPLVQIVNPDVAINKLHTDVNKQYYQDLLKALHLNYIDQAQSGIAKDKDMETRYQFIMSINNDWFDRIIPHLIDAVLMLRNVQTENGVTTPYAGDYVIVKPTQFAIKTEQDLLDEYKTAKDSGVPDLELEKKLEDYNDKVSGGDKVLHRKRCIINEMDILAVMNNADKQIAVMNNAATNRDWQLSINLPSILNNIVREKGSDWFLDTTYDVIRDMVMAMFNKIKPPIPTVKSDTLVVDKTNIMPLHNIIAFDNKTMEVFNVDSFHSDRDIINGVVIDCEIYPLHWFTYFNYCLN